MAIDLSENTLTVAYCVRAMLAGASRKVITFASSVVDKKYDVYVAPGGGMHCNTMVCVVASGITPRVIAAMGGFKSS